MSATSAEPRPPPHVRPAARLRAGPTAAIWAVSLLSLVVAGMVTTEFVLVPVSLDLDELAEAGTDPWRQAAIAAGLFTALLVVTGVSLRLWHSVRFKALALALTAAEVVAVAWSIGLVLRDYF